MDTLELLREAAGIGEPADRPRRDSRYPFGYDPLEARPLLSAASPAVVPIGPAVGGGAGATPIGGQVGSLQLTEPVNQLLASAARDTVSFYETPGSLSLASGLLGFPISPLLTPTVTANETPFDNGTPITGTVWITEAPQPEGIFHFGTTASPVFSHLYLQTVNPQGGPPSFSHFGEDVDGSMNGVEIEEPVAVGPVGPSITIEIQPVQPPPVAAQQLVGPPAQLQQDETTTRNDSRTPPGGIEQPDQQMMPGTGGLRRGPTPTLILRGRPRFGGGMAATPVMPVLPPGTSASLVPPEAQVMRPAGRLPGGPGVLPPAGPGPQGAPGVPSERRKPQGPRGGQPMGRESQGAPAPPPPRQEPCVAPGAPSAVQPQKTPSAPPAGQEPKRTPDTPPAGQEPKRTPDTPPAGQEPKRTPDAPSPAGRPQGDSSGAAGKDQESNGDTASLPPGTLQESTGLAFELIDAAIPGVVAGY